jgi:hypothetical protein
MPLTTAWKPLAIAAATVLLLACGGDDSTDPPKAATDAIPATDTAPDSAAEPEPAANESSTSARKPVEKIEDPESDAVTLNGTDASGRPFRARVGTNVEVPDDFPKDVPLYPEAAPMATMTAEGHGSFISFRTEKSQQDIYDFYMEQLVVEGWTIESENSFRGQLSITSVKDVRQLEVNIAGTEGDSRVSVVITDRE